MNLSIRKRDLRLLNVLPAATEINRHGPGAVHGCLECVSSFKCIFVHGGNLFVQSIFDWWPRYRLAKAKATNEMDLIFFENLQPPPTVPFLSGIQCCSTSGTPLSGAFSPAFLVGNLLVSP